MTTITASLTCLAALAAATTQPIARDDGKYAHGDAKSATAAEFLSGSCDTRRVTLEADVSDVIDDETNPNYAFLVLDAAGETIYAPIRRSAAADKDLPSLVGARVRATGVCDPYVPEPRKQMGRQLYISDINDVETLLPAPEDKFAVPEIGDTRLMTPSEISRLGCRRAEGRVLASWSGRESLLQTAEGRILRATFADSRAPETGASVEVVGRPASDVYRVNIERAAWRPVAPIDIPEQSATNISAREIMLNAAGQVEVKPQFLGRTVAMRGIVRSIQENEDGTVLNVENGAFAVPVHVPADTDAEIGCVVEVTGTCVLNVDNWRPNAAFPQIRGFFVVTRGAEGVKIVSRPPWWTPGRLLAVIGLLLAAIGVVLAWNISLRKLAERRGRALLKAHLEQAKAELKIAERTRLAAELHDSLAQNLTGVAMEISAARRKLPEGSASAAIEHLEFASNAIDSSRDELRNCIWDLRGSALDETDMNKAVRFALSQHLGDTRLSVRFSAPRKRLSDALAHAALRIIRELTTNSIRHGCAKSVRIAGCIDGERLVFSVEDDGRGFDTASAPGLDQGHFGLQGIRERVEGFNGTFDIRSAPGQGARAIVILPLAEGIGKEDT